MKEEQEFKNYKEKQKYYRKLSKKTTSVYDVPKLNQKPYRKYKNRKVERHLKKESD